MITEPTMKSKCLFTSISQSSDRNYVDYDYVTTLYLPYRTTGLEDQVTLRLILDANIQHIITLQFTRIDMATLIQKAPAILVTSHSTSVSKHLKTDVSNLDLSTTRDSMRLPSSHHFDTSMLRISMPGPIFRSPMGERSQAGYAQCPTRPSQSYSMIRTPLPEREDEKQKKLQPCRETPLADIESSTPCPSWLSETSPGKIKPMKRNALKDSVPAISPVMQLMLRRESGNIPENYWPDGKLGVKIESGTSLSASLRVHAGSIEDISSYYKPPEGGEKTDEISVQDIYMTDHSIREDVGAVTSHLPMSDVVRKVHMVTCECGRTLHVKCSNSNTSMRKSSVSETSTIPPIMLSLLPPTKGHKFKPITEVIKSMKSIPEDEDLQLNACQDLGYYADETMIEVLVARQDAVVCLIKAVNNFPTNAALLKEAVLSLLKYANSSDTGCVSIINNGGIDALLDVIKSKNCDLYLATIACKTLVCVGHSCKHIQCCCEDGLKLSKSKIEVILKLFEMYPGDADIHGHICSLISTLILEAEADDILHEITSGLLKSLSRFPTNTDVIGKACIALGVIASTKGFAKDIAKFLLSLGSVEAVLGTLMKHVGNPSVQECGLWALSCLSQASDSCCIRLFEHSGLKLVTQVMTLYPDDEELQEYAIWIISNFSARGSILPHVVDSAVIDLLVKAMLTHEENVNIYTQVAFVIEQGAAVSDELKHAFVELGGVDCLVNGMIMFPECKDFQENTISALGNIAVEESLRIILTQEGAVTAIVDTMLRCHMEMSEAIQQYGCSALANIAHMVPNNKIFVVNNSGVHALVNCLANFKERRECVVSALGAMANISGHDVTNLRLVEGNSIPHVMDAMKTYPDDETIMHLSCSVLADLVCVNGIPDETLIQIAKSVMELHDTDDKVNEQLALVTAILLENLKYSGTTGLKVFDHVKGLEVILKLMQKYPNHVEILKSGCKLITMLVLDGHPGTSKMAEIICYIIKTFKHNETLELLACGALSYLTAGTEKLYHSNLLPHLRAIMDIHPQNERIQVVVLLSIRNRLMKGLDEFPPSIVMQIVRTMKGFPDNSEIQICGCEILDFMTKSESGKGELKNTDAVTLIEDTMQRFNKLEQIQESGTHMIQALREDMSRE